MATSMLLLLATSMLLAASVHGQFSSGFLSIDCGKRKSYNDSRTGLLYVTDSGYIDAGEVHEVADDLKDMGHYVYAYDLRSFPNGTRNCYTLLTQMGNKYLLRAFFLYGNYDGLNQIPKFDLYVGTNFWSTINIRNSSINYYYEVIVMAPANSISVCLVNTGHGVPFISALELRPLKDNLYLLQNSSRSLALFSRLNFAAANMNQPLRYPSDIYDRIWTPFTKAGWTKITTTSKVDIINNFEPSAEVMGTAAAPTNGSSLNVSFATGQSQRFFIALHFAELQQLTENQTRLFNISVNGMHMYGPTNLTYLSIDTIYIPRPVTLDKIDISVYEATGSTLPPILNAMEIYIVRQMTNLATHSGDVDAIMKIRGLYQVKRNWMGDPCAPKSLLWDSLNCSYDESSNISRIISLKLGSFGLIGGIPIVLANFTQLESLDLSNNSLNGTIPDFLSELQHLKLLDLSGNELSGKIPRALQERSTSGALKLSVANNPELCTNDLDQCGKGERKSSSKTVIIVVPIVLVVLILTALALVILRKVSKSSTANSKGNKKQASIGGSLHLPSFHSDSRSFTYAELKNITKNFSKTIGKGGFGEVYHGIRENGTQVAVKVLSQSSSQGEKEFQIEAQLLTRVHHKNLVPLVGYCKDNNYMALVYEYMAGGSLQSRLSGKAYKSMRLSWSNRIQIAVESAQGLEYLHKGCSPAIVHRDVKTSNILLTERLEARVADFGLSKTFQNGAVTPISTIVMGTPGYLDPEYHTSNKLNEKSDVYSFGVVLLELITGLPAIINVVENVTIVKWVEARVTRGVISEIVDPSLQGEYDIDSAWKVVELALACTSSLSIQRPTMTEVIMLLKECVEMELHDARRQELRSTNQSDHISIEVVPMQMSTITSPLAR